MSGWIYLITAILMEVSGTTCMKISRGFSRFWPSLLIFLFYGTALVFLTLALKKIQISTAYAVWSALGTALIAIIGFVLFKENITTLKVISIALIILGVIGLNVSGSGHP